MHAVLDAETGHVFPGRLTTAVGAEYRLDSALLIADPLSAMMAEAREDTSNAAVLLHCASCGSPAAYRWTGTRFEPVGRGAHPHLYPPDASGP
jgi:hypothetical protein